LVPPLRFFPTKFSKENFWRFSLGLPFDIFPDEIFQGGYTPTPTPPSGHPWL
jgi:hypothetical protein